MPPRLVRCRSCGGLLNPELKPARISPPEPRELREISATRDAVARGYYVACPNCEQELRISAKYAGQTVQCKFCTAPFHFVTQNPSIRRMALYADCPHCRQELRVALKYLGKKVACKHCNGALRITEPGRETV
jgi:ribosomal protein S27E